MQDWQNYFVSKSAFYCFVLTHLQGKQRNDLLGITDQHYETNAAAIQWHAGLVKELHVGPNAYLAMNKLNELLKDMTADY